MPKITYTEKKDYNQKLLTEPSVHPIWSTVNNVVDKGANLALWWKGLSEGFKFLGKQVDNTGTKYYGNYNPQTAEPYIVHPDVITVPAT